MSERTIYKRSGFKNYSDMFWVNEKSVYGCRYQCKHCGFVTHGMYGNGRDYRMHTSTCPAMKESAR